MRKRRSTKALVFAAWLLPLLAGALAAYPRLLDPYSAVALDAANALSRRLSPPTALVEVEDRQGWSAVVLDAHGGPPRRYAGWEFFVRHFIFVGLVFVPPLLLATPAPLAARLRLLLLGLALLFATQVLALVGLMRGKLCLSAEPGTFACLWLLRLVYASGQIGGLAIWGLLAWRRWFPAAHVGAPENP
jgi:hypothetical protein